MWISLDDRVPEPYQKVMTVSESENGYYYGIDYWFNDKFCSDDVIAWMPIPEYEGGEK